MIYEGKLKLINNSYFTIAAFILAVLITLYFLNILEEKYLYSSLGILIVLVFSYFITNSKVRVEVNEGQLTIYYSGMVQGNVAINSINQLTEKTQGKINGVEIVTDDNLRYFMPTSCFNEATKQEIISQLQNA